MRIFPLLTIAMTLLAGCNRMDKDTRLEIRPEQLECTSEGGEFHITVSGPCDWVTDNTARWISIRKKDGYAIVTVDPDKGADRQRLVRFRSGGREACLSIIQTGDNVFTIDRTRIETDYKGGSYTVSVECHEPWEISCGSGWVSTDIDGASSPQDVRIEIESSTEKEERQTEILFMCADMKLVLQIYQGPGPYIALERETVGSDGDGGTFSVLYISNTDVQTHTEDDWIRLIGGLDGQNKVAFEVLRNTSGAREGKIVLTSVIAPEYGKTITVQQGPKIDHPALHFEEGHSMEISERTSFVLHPVFTDMTDHSLTWSSDHPDMASISEDGTVTVHTGGTCTITATNVFHDVSASISLHIRLKATDMKISLDGQEMETNPLAVRFSGEELTLTPVMVPEDAYTGDIVCISSDPSVASVSGMTIRCMAPGSATISVESQYHGIRKSFSLLILEE